jgi:Co/Zn/Cd efflux system component
MKVIRAIYNFIVGDMIILVGVIVAAILLTLIENVSALAPLRTIAGAFLILAVLVVLIASLSREVLGKR